MLIKINDYLWGLLYFWGNCFVEFIELGIVFMDKLMNIVILI